MLKSGWILTNATPEDFRKIDNELREREESEMTPTVQEVAIYQDRGLLCQAV